MGHLYWKHIGHEPYEIKHGRFSVGGGDRFAVLERCATQDNPNGCITNSTQGHQIQKRTTILRCVGNVSQVLATKTTR